MCDRIKNVPIVFIFGDRDWMNKTGAEQNSEINSAPVIIEIVSNAGHHLHLDNPSELAEKIIKSLHRIDEINCN